MLETDREPVHAGRIVAGVVHAGNEFFRVGVGYRDRGIDFVFLFAHTEHHIYLTRRIFVGDAHIGGDVTRVRCLALGKRRQGSNDVGVTEKSMALELDARDLGLNDGELHGAAVKRLLGHKHLHGRKAA